jgi:hypothetical protein
MMNDDSFTEAPTDEELAYQYGFSFSGGVNHASASGADADNDHLRFNFDLTSPPIYDFDTVARELVKVLDLIGKLIETT